MGNGQPAAILLDNVDSLGDRHHCGAVGLLEAVAATTGDVFLGEATMTGAVNFKTVCVVDTDVVGMANAGDHQGLFEECFGHLEVGAGELSTFISCRPRKRSTA